MKFEPIWKHKKYTVGYFIEGLKLVNTYIGICSIKGFFIEGLIDAIHTFITVVKGKPLLYKYKGEKEC